MGDFPIHKPRHCDLCDVDFEPMSDARWKQVKAAHENGMMHRLTVENAEDLPPGDLSRSHAVKLAHSGM